MLKKHQPIQLITVLSLFLLMLIPSFGYAAEPLYLSFVSASDSTLTQGVPHTIFFNLYNSDGTDISGNVKASFTFPDGSNHAYPVQGAGNPYSISDLTPETIGSYILSVTDNQGRNVSTYLTVIDPTTRVVTLGNLEIDQTNVMTLKLIDLYGTSLAKKAVTIDGTAVGANPSILNLTTLNDGTATFSMTPTQEGTVKIIYSGDIVGTIRVGSGISGGARLGGTTQGNADLSVAIAQAGWEKAGNVILTRDDVLADAMVAVPLSKRLDAPILMTSPNALNLSVQDEIQRLAAQNVYIIGGVGAVSGDVEQKLKDNGLNVERIAGLDRYATAGEIAKRLGPSNTVYLAYGYGEADAAAASVPAALNGIPILLTETNGLPEVTQEQLKALAPQNVVILGGTGVISQTLQDQLSQTYQVERWGGKDRFDTEEIIMQKTFRSDKDVYFTTAQMNVNDVQGGIPYGDALLTAALAAKNQANLVTLPVDQPSFSLSAAPYHFLLLNQSRITGMTIVGNESAVSRTQEEHLEQLLDNE